MVKTQKLDSYWRLYSNQDNVCWYKQDTQHIAIRTMDSLVLRPMFWILVLVKEVQLNVQLYDPNYSYFLIAVPEEENL